MDNTTHITMLDENDKSVSMEVVASLKVNNVDYAILKDAARDEDYIFKVSGDPENQTFEMVEDETVLREVVDAYYELID
ncbi:MAG: hypothetical protein CSB19_00595 [Clostridiales bacterium]|nr:MAG: hypothetical protein CSB19_00595 [Clostridiales bacterium]